MPRAVVLLLPLLVLGALSWRRFVPLLEATGLVTAAAPALASGPRVAVPAPLSQKQWLGPDGVGVDGYPLRHVNKVALVTLVRAGEFDRAQRFLELVQTGWLQLAASS